MVWNSSLTGMMNAPARNMATRRNKDHKVVLNEKKKPVMFFRKFI